MDNSDHINVLWAKKSHDTDEPAWLPLIAHLSDTKSVMNFLWENNLQDADKDLLCRSFSPELDHETGRRVLQFLAASHDLGKSSAVFQCKVCDDGSGETDAALRNKLIDADIPVKHYIELPKYQIRHAQAGFALLKEGGCNRNLASVIGAHHGTPGAMIAKTSDRAEDFYLEDAGKAKWQGIQHELIQYILEISGWKTLSDLPEPSFNILPWLTGLLILADWLASSEDNFPLISLQKTASDVPEERLDREKLAIFARGWHLSEIETFQERFHFIPTKMQTNVMEISETIPVPGILIAESAMGSGKTEAALAASERFAKRFQKTGIFFALPSQATSDGMFRRAEQFIDSFHASGSFNLVHGKSEFNEDFNALPHFGKCTSEDEDDEECIGVYEWFRGRKTALLADFVIGTVDQLLMAGLQQKHVMLRHLGLAKKVVIIDEVHAYDAFMSTYLMRTLQWLGAYHVPVILLSATLPYNKKIDLVRAYLGEKDTAAPEFSDASTCITYTDGKNILEKTLPAENSRNVYFESMKEEEAFQQIQARMSEGGCIGIIRTSAKEAQETYRSLRKAFPNTDIILIHAGFLSKDRVKIEREIRMKLGSPRNPDVKRPQKCIVIGTCVLEQSLDICFDWLLTDPAPIDLLFQRVGRLHRHERKNRPPLFRRAVCTVIVPEDEKNPSEKIYGKYLLDKTKCVLPEKVTIPDDMPHLVEEVYDHGSEDDPGYSDWKDKIAVQTGKAKDFLVARPLSSKKRFRQDMTSFMKSDLASLSEENGEARVRDTNGSIEVILFSKRASGDYIITSNTPIDWSSLASGKDLAAETVRLPYSLSNPGMMDDVIEALESITKALALPDNPWLKGRLILPLYGGNAAELCVKGAGYRISYDNHTGLSVEKEEL